MSKHNTPLRSILLDLAALTSIAAAPMAGAASLYWDTNDTGTGSGNVGGTWDAGTNWTTGSAGTSTTVPWTNGEEAIFSAGTDGTDPKTVTISGSISTPSIHLEEFSLVTLSGGEIDITGGTIFDTSVLGTPSGNSLNWSPAITGSGNLTLAVHGDTSDTGGGSDTMFTLSGANDFVGDVIIRSGVVHGNSNFGAGSNKVVLRGGGIIDNNLNIDFTRDIEVPASRTGIYRTWDGVSTGQISGSLTGSGTLKHTDGGTLNLTGDGSGFAGTLEATRGQFIFSTNDWQDAAVVSTEDTSSLRFKAGGITTIDSLISDRDVHIEAGNILNIASGNFTVATGTGGNNFSVQNAGSLTSSSGTLTCDYTIPFTAAGADDQAIQVSVVDFDGSTPLTLVKNGPGAISRFDKVNTYTGGTIINGGRINVQNVLGLGSGDAVVNSGGQAFLKVGGGTYANKFRIAGIGSTEDAGELGAIRFQNNTVSGEITVTANARIVCDSGASGTVSGALTGSGDLEINIPGNPSANGTANLTGDASSYSGNLLVSGGRLNLGSATSGGGLTVDDDGTFDGETSFTGDIALGTILGGTLVIDAGTTAALTTTGSLTLTGTTIVSVDNMSAGTTTVANYGSTLTGDASKLALAGGVADYRPGTGFDTTGTANEVLLKVVAKNLIWTGALDDIWDLNSRTNWKDASAVSEKFFNADSVLFDDSAPNTARDVTLSGELAAGSITIDSTRAGNNFSITGTVSDFINNGSLLKKGDSELIIDAPNTFTGGTVISGGSIDIRQAAALGNGTVTLGDTNTGNDDVALYLDTNRVSFNREVIVSGNGTGTATLGSRATVGGAADNNQFLNVVLQRDVVFDSNANDRTDYENISGTGSVTITGTSRAIFPANNPAWTGDLTVDGGTLQVGVAGTGGDRIPDGSKLTINNGGSVVLSTNAETIAGLNGDGTINSNQPPGGLAVLTVGSGDASGSFSGDITQVNGTIAITKIGTGTQILSGNTTYKGVTTVAAGVLSLTNPVALDDDSTVNINGTGVLNLAHTGEDQVAILHLDGTPAANGSYGSSASSANNVDNAHFSGPGVLWVGPASAYLFWEDSFGILGAGSETDSDDDSVVNGIEFVIGGDPTDRNSMGLLPTVVTDTNNMVFNFRRTVQSAPYQTFVEYGSDLTAWTPARNGIDGVEIGVIPDGFGAGIDSVTVKIPKDLATGTTLFARLVVVIPAP